MKKIVSLSLIFLLLISVFKPSNVIYAEETFESEFNSFEFRDEFDSEDEFLDNVLVFGEEYNLFIEKNSDVIYGVKVINNKGISYRSVCLPGDPGYPRCDLYPDDSGSSDSPIDLGEFAKCLIRESFPNINIRNMSKETFVAVGTAVYLRKNFTEAAKFIIREVGEKVVGRATVVAAVLYTAYNSYICIREQY